MADSPQVHDLQPVSNNACARNPSSGNLITPSSTPSAAVSSSPTPVNFTHVITWWQKFLIVEAIGWSGHWSTQVASILGKSIDTCEICLWRRSQTWHCYWSLSTMGDTRLNVILFAPLFSFDWRYYVLSRPYCFYSWRSFRRNSFITMIHGQQRKNHY